MLTLEPLVALSLIDDLPRRGLVARLAAADPTLPELADAFLADARRARAHAATLGIEPLAWNDPRFPSSLLPLDDCPPLLWCRGDLACLSRPAVAMVGSRAASAVAIETATRLASDLAERGVVVVSGLARGVDSAAHRGTLRVGGSTVAVLGSGLARIYPPEHTGLAGEIAVKGLVVSEYPPDADPLPFHFPQRNRLISGLSRGVVVIEASEKSGSLITASFALDQGREVMAVPGNVLNGRNRGGHALIRDGAKIVETADDIVEGLVWTAHAGIGAAVDSSDCQSAGCAPSPVAALEPGRPYDLDELAAVLGLSAAALLARLSDWEIRGLVRRVDGSRFLVPA
jgi:DNA processing protein